MSISKVQSVTGNGATIALNGVVAGNALTLQYSYLRGTTTGLRAATPTDSSGSFTASAGDFNPLPAVFSGGDNGVGTWIHENCSSGTHTVTPEANTIIHSTLTEWSGVATSSSQDVAKSASTINSNQTSQVTGTTAVTAQASELALICLCGGAAIGAANIGLTDPVTGYTTLQVLNNTSTDISVMHNFQILSATGAQSATYTWTDNETQQVSIANIATFKAAGTVDDAVYSYDDASNQPVEPEEWSEVQGFTADPLQPNLPAQVDQLISYFQDEAEEPAEEWLWPDYWAQAPPIPDAVGIVFIEDGSLQPVEHEEQHEVQDFLAAPLSPNAPAAQDQIQVEDADNQPEEDEFAEGFSDAPQTILVADQIYVEDSSLQPIEDDEFLDGFTDAQIDNYDIVQSIQEQPFEEDEAEGFSDAPLAADFSADFVQGEDASAQPDELDDADGQDYNSAPLSDDAIIDADYIEPYDDASSQPDELDDADSQDFVVAPLSDDAPPIPPIPSLVITPGKLPPWPWTWTHDQKPSQPHKTVDYSRDIERAMLLEQRLRAERRRLEQELRAKAAQKPSPKASAPERAQQISLQNRDYAILRRKIKAAEAEHAAAVTREIELRLRTLENEQTVSETVAARRKRELMMVLLLA